MLWRQQKLLRIADSPWELVIALPIELSREEQIGLLQEFIENSWLRRECALMRPSMIHILRDIIHMRTFC